MATPNLVPRADSEGGIGTSSKYWGSAYIDAIYVGAGFVGRDADNNIDFSVDDRIQFEIAGSVRTKMTNSTFFPATNDQISLGVAGTAFSDLFLASGAVINFDNSDVTLTHGSGRLTLADNDKLVFGTGLDLQINHDATNSYVENFNGNLYIDNHHNDGDIIFRSDDGSGGVTTYLTLDGSHTETVFSQNVRFEDNAVAKFGASSDLQIYHNASNSYIYQVGTGNLHIATSTNDGDIVFSSDDGSGGTTPYLTLDGSAGNMKADTDMIFADNKALMLGNSGDAFFKHTGSSFSFINDVGDVTFINRANDADIKFESDNGLNGTATYFYLDGSSATNDGSVSTALYTNWPDKSRISLGTSHDLQIYHDGSDNWIQSTVGNINFYQGADDKDIVFWSDDGSGGVAKYLTLDGGLGYTTVQKQMRFDDSIKAQFGASGDLSIRHDSTNSEIINLTGDLTIQNAADDKDIIFQSDDGSGGTTAYLTLDGGAGFTYSHKKIRFTGDNAAAFGDSDDLQIYHDGNTSIRNDTGNLSIINRADDGDIIFQSDDGSGGVETYFFLDGSAGSGTPITNFPDGSYLTFGASQDLQIYHDGTNSSIQNNTGNLTISNGQDDGDIIFQSDDGSGGTTAYITLDGSAGHTNAHKNILFDDNAKVLLGAGSDLQIYHNGSNSYIENTTGSLNVISATGNINITNNTDDGDITFGTDDGSGGVTEYFRLDGANTEIRVSKKLQLSDNVKLAIGNGEDLEIYHDGSNSYINGAGTGDLYIKNSTDDESIIFQCDDGSGGVETYFQLEGVSGGATPFTVFPDSSTLSFGSGHDLRILHNGSSSLVENYVGDLVFTQNTDDGDIIFKSDNGSGATTAYITLDGGDVSTIVNTVKVLMPNLPTSDPSVAGQLWNDSNTLKISAG
tara:strand:+ start:1526 stop:4240 length:2715 start_codon:yes stop_codon:yes gene_type:complete